MAQHVSLSVLLSHAAEFIAAAASGLQGFDLLKRRQQLKGATSNPGEFEVNIPLQVHFDATHLALVDNDA